MKIGIVGGGQLAQMLIESRPKHEYIVIDPNPKCPASFTKSKIICASYSDARAMQKLVDLCDFITYEFENINTKTLLLSTEKLFPNTKILQISQQRIKEKMMAQELGIPVGKFYEIENWDKLSYLLKNEIGSWILKTMSDGYDGKGQMEITSDTPIDQIKNNLKLPCLLERKIDFEYETSIIMHRNQQGQICHLPLTRNIHKNGILSFTHNLKPVKYANKIEQYAKKIMAKFDLIGTLTIEFFITKQGPLFNEIAPRVHNSGHWSIEGTNNSQFCNHIDAITNKNLLITKSRGYSAMINIIGDNINKIRDKSLPKNVFFHDYHKSEVRPNRKMGHITIIDEDRSEVKRKLDHLLEELK